MWHSFFQMAHIPHRPIIAELENVTYTKAAIALNNFLPSTKSSLYCPPGFANSEDGDGNFIVGCWQEEKGLCRNIETI